MELSSLGVHQSNHSFFTHFEVWEEVENNMLPIPFDHSLYLTKLVQLQLQFCLPKFAHVELSLAQEVYKKKRLDRALLKFENRPRTTR